jgi:hypothetical protein
MEHISVSCVYAVDVNLLEDNTYITKNTETLTDASIEVGLDVEEEKPTHNYMLLSRHQNSGQNNDIKMSNVSFENTAQLKYLATTVTNEYFIQD